jgi:hypothetical protein
LKPAYEHHDIDHHPPRVSKLARDSAEMPYL